MRHHRLRQDGRAFRRHQHRDAGLPPFLVRHADDAGFRDRRVRQQYLLHLARIHVGPAGDVHVGLAAGDMEEAARIEVTEVPGVEPSAGKGLRRGVLVAEIARHDSGAAHADLPRLVRRQPPALRVEDRDLDPRARIAAGPDREGRVILEAVPFGRQDGDVPGDLAEAEILHQARPQLPQRVLLVLPVHRRAGVDHVSQAGMVMRVHARVAAERIQDGRHGEHVADAVLLHQPPGFRHVEPFPRQQHGHRAARHLRHGMDARPMRQRRHHQRGIALRQPRHQVRDVVRHHEGELPMRQRAALGPPRGAGGVEQPGGMVPFHRRGLRDRRVAAFRHQVIPGQARPFPDRDVEHARAVLRARCRAVFWEAGVEDVRAATGIGGEVGHLRRAQAEIGRHPDRADQPAGPTGFEDGIAVPGMDQHTVALADPPCTQRPRRGGHALSQFGPTPAPVPPDQRRAVRQPPRGLQQQARQVRGGDHAMFPPAARSAAPARRPQGGGACGGDGGKASLAAKRRPAAQPVEPSGSNAR